MLVYCIVLFYFGFTVALPTTTNTVPTTVKPMMPCICTMDYRPVCGVDGITYGNKCGMDCVGVALSQEGECPVVNTQADSDSEAVPTTVKPMMPCICTMDYRPVCGVDGNTYGNKCAMDCVGVALSQEGECPVVNTQADFDSEAVPTTVKPMMQCICTMDYRPVCGVDGNTYGNKCAMDCVGVALSQEGKCPVVNTQADSDSEAVPCICPFIYLPVCGADGITYGNNCNLHCAGVAQRHEGVCIVPTTTSPSTTVV